MSYKNSHKRSITSSDNPETGNHQQQEKSDHLYLLNENMPSNFQFDSRVAQVFQNMIQRSVPGYGLTLEMIGMIAARYAQQGSQLYDLGCSLGASTIAMRHAIEGRDCNIVAVDMAQAMLDRCQQVITGDDANTPVTLVVGDVCTQEIVDASMVVLNFTLQFIPVAQRLSLLQQIHQGMRPDGVLVLSEKISFDEDWQNQVQQSLHEAFKQSQGYSSMEISRKRQALENVLLPETVENHRQRLLDAGFSRVCIWFQCVNFVSLLAFR